MPSLVFDKGYKEYDINGDKNCVIRVNTSDWNIIGRIDALRERIAGKVSALQSINDDYSAVMEAMRGVEREVRAEVDEALGSPVCDTAFGGINCLSFAGGQPIVVNFLEAILPEIKKDLETEAEQAERRAEKYTAAVKQFD